MDVRDQLRAALAAALTVAGVEPVPTEITLERPANPEHGDWFWVKYLPDGSVARTPADKGNKPIKGRFASCIECHASADGDDYVFAND